MFIFNNLDFNKYSLIDKCCKLFSLKNSYNLWYKKRRHDRYSTITQTPMKTNGLRDEYNSLYVAKIEKTILNLNEKSA